ncbi:MAG: nucleotidyltransferase family protein [Thermodesulfobacteriota bacterium]
MNQEKGKEQDKRTKALTERLREMKPQLFEKYKARRIQLFGSVAREEQTEDSDIDILVDFEEDADYFDLAGMAIFLEEQLRRKVDVISKQGLRNEIRESVLKEAIPI